MMTKVREIAFVIAALAGVFLTFEFCDSRSVAMTAVQDGVGPAVLSAPFGLSCRTWVAHGETFVEVRNEADVSITGTLELNEIYEKVLPVTGCGAAEIDGRWIELKVPSGETQVWRLGK